MSAFSFGRMAVDFEPRCGLLGVGARRPEKTVIWPECNRR